MLTPGRLTHIHYHNIISICYPWSGKSPAHMYSALRYMAGATLGHRLVHAVVIP